MLLKLYLKTFPNMQIGRGEVKGAALLAQCHDPPPHPHPGPHPQAYRGLDKQKPFQNCSFILALDFRSTLLKKKNKLLCYRYGVRGCVWLVDIGGRRPREEELINSEANSHDIFFFYIPESYLDFKTNTWPWFCPKPSLLIPLHKAPTSHPPALSFYITGLLTLTDPVLHMNSNHTAAVHSLGTMTSAKVIVLLSVLSGDQS